MMDRKIYCAYRYKIEMTYMNILKKINTPIRTDCIKSVIIDHNYDNNCMPIIYATLTLDRSMIDDMILNANTNLILMTEYKYDEITDTKQEIECFRDKFVYFLPDDVNKTKSLDYNTNIEEETMTQTYSTIIIGLISVNHINRNKRLLGINASNNTIFDCVKYCTSGFSNLIIEPFAFNETYERIIMPEQESVNKALRFLNSYRVFYYTPYRYYQDFNYTYIISSSGKPISRNDETFSTVIINIKDVEEIGANEFGVAINKSARTYEVDVNYANTNVYDNSFSNKSRSIIKGVSSTGTTTKTLSSTASYCTDKTNIIRLNNDNDNMIYNMEANINNKNVLVYIGKNDLDSDIFTINKRISIHHINRYIDFNGDYLLNRKRESLIREDDSFIMTTMLNLSKIERNNETRIMPFTISK